MYFGSHRYGQAGRGMPGLMLILGLLCFPTPTPAALYDITPISLQTARHYPSINNQGTVAYLEYSTQSALGVNLKTAAGQTIVIDSDVAWPSPAARIVSLNNQNQVLFWGKTDAGTQLRNGLYLGSAAGTTLLTNDQMIQAASGSSAAGSMNPAVFLSNNGTAYFDYSGNTTTNQFRGRGFYTTNGSDFTTVSTQSLVSPLLPSPFERLAMSPEGSLAYEYLLGSSRAELRVVHQGVERTVATIPALASQLGSIRSIDINDQGTLAISATLLQGGSTTTDAGLYVSENGSFTKRIATSAADVYQSIGDVAINNSNLLAFTAIRPLSPGVTGNGIYIGPNGAPDKVVAVGDLLSGVPVDSLLLSPSGLNDAGQIVFWAGFANGSGGVFLATPTAVPEPGTWSLAGLLGIATAYAVQRRYASKESGIS